MVTHNTDLLISRSSIKWCNGLPQLRITSVVHISRKRLPGSVSDGTRIHLHKTVCSQAMLHQALQRAIHRANIKDNLIKFYSR